MFRSLTLAALFILMLTGCANEPKQQALPAPTEAEKAQHAKTFATAPPEWSKNLNIYEVNLRQYTKAGTFAAFEQELPRLQEMGVGILWFMPIHPIGQKNRKGKMGSYYSVKDYQAVAPEYGTLDDFKRLVEKAHKMRMFVIIDWVANHTSWDNVWTTTNPDFYTKNEKGKFKPPVDDWR
ncbi:MAG: hypothetical protein IPN25_13930 [Sphingobacteriales bacterium]|nr:hypothetical protein [Sphingobacteriales bacterium]